MTDWIDDRRKELDDQRKARAEKHGFKETLRLEVGETPLTIDTSKEPREIGTQYGKRLVLGLKEPANKEFIINPNSPLWRDTGKTS